MWGGGDKKFRPNRPERQSGWVPATFPKLKDPIEGVTERTSSSFLSGSQSAAVLGRSLAVRGELSGDEDLLIEGQFDGAINVEERCVTIASHARVRANIRARRAVIHGLLSGNVSAREKIEVGKTAHVLGDLITAAIAIEDGASFKGSIELVPDETHETPRGLSRSSADPARADDPEDSLATRSGSS